MEDFTATTGKLNFNPPEKSHAGGQLRHYSLFKIEAKKVRQQGQLQRYRKLQGRGVEQRQIE